jgi:hypothetical protein
MMDISPAAKFHVSDDRRYKGNVDMINAAVLAVTIASTIGAILG